MLLLHCSHVLLCGLASAQTALHAATLPTVVYEDLCRLCCASTVGGFDSCCTAAQPLGMLTPEGAATAVLHEGGAMSCCNLVRDSSYLDTHMACCKAKGPCLKASLTPTDGAVVDLETACTTTRLNTRRSDEKSSLLA